MDAAVSVARSIKVAWDNLDPGLKQWILIGLSVVAMIALPGIGGILLSCLIDGTLVDMFTAITTGDWAMLGLSLLAFIPGAKAVKGLKAVGGSRGMLKGFEKTTIKKGTRLSRIGGVDEGGRDFSHGRSYTKTELRGLSKQEIKLGVNPSRKNPQNTVYEYSVRDDFVAYVGKSEGGIFDEVYIKGGGNHGILELVKKWDVWYGI